MERIDKIVFGDNQFFGINHRSQEKAEELGRKFSDIHNIISVYDTAFDCGIKAVMLNSNDRAKDIVQIFRDHKATYGDIAWYPSIPYPHKYANMVTEKGILPTINDVLFNNNSAGGVFSSIVKGGQALLTKDLIKMMEMLIDVEYRIFKGLQVKVLFLQNVITDLVLGYDIKEVFQRYCEFIRKKYGILPGFITLNLPYLLDKLKEWEIEDVVVCSSINKVGFNMSPSKEAYLKVIAENDPSKYQLMAMSTLASGAIPPKEAYDFINGLNIQSVVFGASSRKNIESTVSLIKI